MMTETAKDDRPNPSERANKCCVREYDASVNNCPACGMSKSEYTEDYNKKYHNNGGRRAWPWHFRLCTVGMAGAAMTLAEIKAEKKKVADNTARELRALEKDKEDWAEYTARKDAKRAAKKDTSKYRKEILEMQEDTEDWEPTTGKKTKSRSEWKEWVNSRPRGDRARFLPSTATTTTTTMTFGQPGQFIVKGKRKLQETHINEMTDEVEIIEVDVPGQPSPVQVAVNKKPKKAEPAVQGFSPWHTPPPEEPEPIAVPKQVPATLPPAALKPIDGVPMPMELADEKKEEKKEEKKVEPQPEKKVAGPSNKTTIPVGDLPKQMILSMTQTAENLKVELVNEEAKLKEIKSRHDIVYRDWFVCKALYEHQVRVIENLRKEMESVQSLIETAKSV